MMNKAAVTVTWSVPHIPIVTRCGRAAASNSSVAAAVQQQGGVFWKLLDQQFPLHRIYCVARNYKDHAIEMNADARDPPFFFLKPADTAICTYRRPPSSAQSQLSATTTTKTLIRYPSRTSNLHYEGELAIAIGKDQPFPTTTRGKDDVATINTIDSIEDAMSFVFGYAIACDLTRRDLQKQAKDNGRPRDTSKAFEGCCPMSAIVPREEMISLTSSDSSSKEEQMLSMGTLQTYVNNDCRQDGKLGDMTWSVPEIIMHLSQYYQLRAGDLILTGTPAGVGPINIGDTVRIQVGMEGKDIMPLCEFEIS